jgi:hypothetical protein
MILSESNLAVAAATNISAMLKKVITCATIKVFIDLISIYIQESGRLN